VVHATARGVKSRPTALLVGHGLQPDEVRPAEAREDAVVMSLAGYHDPVALVRRERVLPDHRAPRLLDAVHDAAHAERATCREVHATLSRLGIAGGAVYDGLVALAAQEHGLPLATRDARARGTYGAVGVQVILVT
jgi:hypothetical protein